jgi:hypothetical protein
MDVTFRTRHHDPFAVVPEATWAAQVAATKLAVKGAGHDERVVALARLAGLLDTHTQFFGDDQTMYQVLLYRFADGVFVVAAADPAMIGWRLDSIAGTPTAQVEAMMKPLIPGDNDSARLNATYLLAYVDLLHGLGIIHDVAKPGFAFTRPDGTTTTVDLAAQDSDDFFEQQHALGSLVGTQDEAVGRRAESIWSRVDAPSNVFLLALNDYTLTGRSEALSAMTAALDSGAATRVVVDMRYLRGGQGNLLFPVVDALVADPRVDRPGGLTVLIGRENESAATVIAAMLDEKTSATFVGEMTPARADNFLCACADVKLSKSGYTFSVPTDRSGNGDARPAVMPDVPVAMTSSDFFAGKDPALSRALSG